MRLQQPEDLNSEFEEAWGEDPHIDLRDPIAEEVGRLEKIGLHPFIISLMHRGATKTVELKDIELKPGRETGTLLAKVHRTVGEHKLTSTGVVTVATILAAVAAARIHSNKKDNKK